MWDFLYKFFSNDETSIVVSSVNDELISDTYSSIETEIKSLQKYDKGEKDIHAPNLGSAVRGL